MRKDILLAAVWTLALMIAADDLFARGGGRGGGFSGGGRAGGMAAGGGFSGGARPAPSAAFNRSPSMSRPMAAPAMSRPAGGFAGGNAAGGDFAARHVGTAGGAAAVQSPGAFQRPTQSQLGNFLNMPQQGNPGAFSGGARPPASQLPSSGGGKTYTTAGGSTITVGGKGGSTTTPGGVTIGGGAGGIKIEGAGGNTYGKVVGGVGASDGANSAVRGGSATAIQGAGGNSAANIRGGYANSSGYRQGGSITAVQGKGGYTAVSARGGYGIGGTGQVGAVAGIRGPGGATVGVGRGASFVNGQFVGGQAWQSVNGNFRGWNHYGPGMAARYPGAWWPGKWAIATTAWATATWALAGGYCGCSGSGAYYDYGQNVTYDDGNVNYGDQPVATAEQFYDQANTIAAAGQSSTDEQWMPLGVFGVIAEGQTNTDKLVQLAINPDGAIRGNYQDLLSDKVTPVIGSVNKESQRVALKLEGNDALVVETGLYNLTNDEVPVLIHFGPDRQEARTFIRLKQPEEPQPAEQQQQDSPVQINL